MGIFVLAAPPPVGDANIRYNTIRHNNKKCPPGDDGGPALSGSGVLLAGATGTTVAHNSIVGNKGRTPGSGGIVLVGGRRAHLPPATGNLIQNNTAYGDAPADIVDHSGGRNTIRYNHCRTSMPAGYCHG